MTSAELRAALSAEPFVPFRLRFGSGKVVPVEYPELVVVSQTGRTAFAYRPHSDGFDVIDILLVESMEFDGNGRGRNGHAPRRKRR
jgi:hypothetical protein